MTTFAAIPTTYSGHKFRSRLEARWAVFFDAAGIRWIYEPEGIPLPFGWYLPDFILPEHGWLIEIKPRMNNRRPKHRVFVWQHTTKSEKIKLKKYGHLRFAVICGTPGHVGGGWYEGFTYKKRHLYWAGLADSGKETALRCLKDHPHVDSGVGRAGFDYRNGRLLRAYDKASMARFDEHRKKGK